MIFINIWQLSVNYYCEKWHQIYLINLLFFQSPNLTSPLLLTYPIDTCKACLSPLLCHWQTNQWTSIRFLGAALLGHRKCSLWTFPCKWSILRISGAWKFSTSWIWWCGSSSVSLLPALCRSPSHLNRLTSVRTVVFYVSTRVPKAFSLVVHKVSLVAQSVRIIQHPSSVFLAFPFQSLVLQLLTGLSQVHTLALLSCAGRFLCVLAFDELQILIPLSFSFRFLWFVDYGGVHLVFSGYWRINTHVSLQRGLLLFLIFNAVLILVNVVLKMLEQFAVLALPVWYWV